MESRAALQAATAAPNPILRAMPYTASSTASSARNWGIAKSRLDPEAVKKNRISCSESGWNTFIRSVAAFGIQ